MGEGGSGMRWDWIVSRFKILYGFVVIKRCWKCILNVIRIMNRILKGSEMI